MYVFQWDDRKWYLYKEKSKEPFKIYSTKAGALKNAKKNLAKGNVTAIFLGDYEGNATRL